MESAIRATILLVLEWVGTPVAIDGYGLARWNHFKVYLGVLSYILLGFGWCSNLTVPETLKEISNVKGQKQKSSSFILLSMGLFGGVAHSCLKVSPRIKVDVCLLRNLSASDSQLEIEHWRSRNYSMWQEHQRQDHSWVREAIKFRISEMRHCR